MEDLGLQKYIGRAYEEYNCFDLVKEFYLEKFDIQLQNYFEGDIVPDRKEIECLIKANKGDLIRVEQPIWGDLVVINLYGYTSHIGVYVGGPSGYFLHSVKTVGSCIEPIYKYRKMIEGCYRHSERFV